MRMLLFALFVALPCLANVRVQSGFEGGSVGRVEIVAPAHIRVAVQGERDQHRRNRQASWYYFRVDNAGDELTIDMVDLPGEYNYKPNRGAITKDTPPVISYDRRTWTHVTDFEYNEAEPRLRLRIKPRRSTFWLAHTPPYTNSDLESLRKWAARHRSFREQRVGKTVGGRDLVLWTIADDPAAMGPTVWLMVRQHSWESGTSWAGEGFVRTLLDADARSGELRKQVIWKILPMCDPDGVARGGVRFNVNGYDLNRNWDTLDPKQMPEIAAQRAAVARYIKSGRKIDLFLTLHNTETAEYLESGPGVDQSLGARLFASLKARTTFDPGRPLSTSGTTTTQGMKGRMTAVQALSAELRIPAFLMEQRIAFNPRLGHLPTIEDRLAFGRLLALALAEVVGAQR